MKSLLVLLSLVIFNCKVFSQNPPCNLRDAYAQVFTVEKYPYKDEAFLVKSAREIDSTSCLAPVVNDHIQYFNYLLTHFCSKAQDSVLLALEDSVELQKSFIQSLEQDMGFNQIIEQLDNRIAQPREETSDTLSMDELMGIAVRYFSIPGFSPKGNYKLKVCTGNIEFIGSDQHRQPHVEAFCFSNILTNFGKEPYLLQEEVMQGVKELYKLDFGTDPDDQLLRAQGAFTMYLKQNTYLHDLLKEAYEQQKYFLPFALQD
ncbi:MAG: hypothetical protein AAGI38_15225 [Bacteroidota bacterium]